MLKKSIIQALFQPYLPQAYISHEICVSSQGFKPPKQIMKISIQLQFFVVKNQQTYVIYEDMWFT